MYEAKLYSINISFRRVALLKALPLDVLLVYRLQSTAYEMVKSYFQSTADLKADLTGLSGHFALRHPLFIYFALAATL